MDRTAIVLGATGLVGRALVEQLVDASHVDNVTITRRSVAHDAPKLVNRVVNFERLDVDAFEREWLTAVRRLPA